MFYLNGNKSTYIPSICAQEAAFVVDVVAFHKVQFFKSKFTYSNYSGESRQWTFSTQKMCLQVELYSHQKINYSELTDYFINRTVADRRTIRTKVCIWSSVFIVEKEFVIMYYWSVQKWIFWKVLFYIFKEKRLVSTRQGK